MAASHYLQLLEEIEKAAYRAGRNPSEIKLVAVSKSHPLESVFEVYSNGCRDLGENRLHEALAKKAAAPADIQWHLIGTLQKNKVSKAIGQFVLIHSVDTLGLAERISACSAHSGLITPILLQANTSGEVSKHGLTALEWISAFEGLLTLPGVDIQGLMTMAPYTANERELGACFSQLRLLLERLKTMAGRRANLRHLSMGMSRDWPTAVREGATLLRIGTSIFGPGSKLDNS